MTDNFLRNWDALKPLVLTKWPKVKHADLEDMPMNAEDLTEIIKNRYTQTPRQTIFQDVVNLNDQIKKY